MVTRRVDPAAVEVYRSVDGTARRRELARSTGDAPTGDPKVDVAFANGERVSEWMALLGRSGWDDAGAPLRLTVGVRDVQGALTSLGRGEIDLGDGDGVRLGPAGAALDVLAHETVHLIAWAEAARRGRPGGLALPVPLGESFSDVLAATADTDDWLIGEDLVTPGLPGDALRDLEHPGLRTVQQVRASPVPVDGYTASGPLSLAGVRAAQVLGRDTAARIWHGALREDLTASATFEDAARATVQASTRLYGADAKETKAVGDAWASVGIRVEPAGLDPHPHPEPRVTDRGLGPVQGIRTRSRIRISFPGSHTSDGADRRHG